MKKAFSPERSQIKSSMSEAETRVSSDEKLVKKLPPNACKIAPQ
jgi:hypothetical protein